VTVLARVKVHDGVAENHERSAASVSQVWAVMSDPYAYADWVVGAKDVRTVEGSWPHVGAKLHHRTGAGPVTIEDETEVIEVEPCAHLKLRAGLRPFGVAEVVIDVRPVDGGTELVMQETFVEGIRGRVTRMVTASGLGGRNVETLRRLSRLAMQEQC